MDTITLNKTVILQKGSVLKAVKLVSDKVIVFEKLKFKPDNAVGHKFGTVFNVQDMQLHSLSKLEKQEVGGIFGQDNRNLTDTFGESQALKRDDLIQLKEDGATGEEIIQSLVENSSSFSQKTVFSQSKYLKKKQKKYCSHVKIHKPSARLICKLYEEREPAKICHMHIDSFSQILSSTNVRSGSKVAVFETCSGVLLGMILERLGGSGMIETGCKYTIFYGCARLICKLYEEREPAKICHMHIDSFSQILSSTNVRSGSKVAVFETCSGVLLGMILERLGGSGSVVNLHVGETPANIFAISHFNFPDSYWDNLHSLPLHKLARLLASHPFESTFPPDTLKALESKRTDGDCIRSREAASNGTDAVRSDTDAVRSDTDAMRSDTDAVRSDTGSQKRKLDLSDEAKQAIRAERQEKRFKHQKEAWSLLESRKMDALVVATKYHPTSVVLSLLQVLALSRPFAVYSEYKEPLMELFVHLSTENAAINLQITDTFLRHYQVLPERTHPRVMMPGNSGYLLTGIKVA